jgi:hypothetical protein
MTALAILVLAMLPPISTEAEEAEEALSLNAVE